MENKLLKYIFAVALLLPMVSIQASSTERLIAFPTAEGYGKYSEGGRGGDVYEVTNLNDGGPGSLRAAVEASGPRTVVFRVSGTINLKSSLAIKNPYITIAGQTAPGDGICLKGFPLLVRADHVIVRYLRVRPGAESGKDIDALSSNEHKNIILDHLSLSWSTDETMSVYHGDSITVQWCIISESLFNSVHRKGTHGFGGIWGSENSSYHHNLIAHHSSRNPRFSSGSGHTDFRNNVIYNWGYNSIYGGERVQKNDPEKYSETYLNIVNNYFKPGPATQGGEVSYRIANPSARSDEDYGYWYINGNYVCGNERVSNNNWDGGVQMSKKQIHLLPKLKLDAPWAAMPIEEHTAQQAYDLVLANAGCSKPNRDAVDRRVLNDVATGTAKYEGESYKTRKQLVDESVPCGIIDKPSDVGGWPELKSVHAPVDSDHDGMPDQWELSRDLDINNPDDRNTIASDGYTMLEHYLNHCAQ